jgi:SAM-dependent methyltransferase
MVPDSILGAFFAEMKELPNEHARLANFEFDVLRAADNYRRALLREFAPHLRGKVIEVGAGIGQITELLRNLPEIQELVSIEPEAAFCDEFRKSFPGQHLIQGTIESLPDAHPVNAIISVNVLEHIRDDEHELAAYGQLLRLEQGHLCLFVPARQEIYAPLDRDFGHHRRYAKAELKSKLERAGFAVLRLNYFNWVGYFAWWLNFCVLKKPGFHAESVRFFDRAVFPGVYWLESRLCRPPFGQSLLAVAQAK